MPRARGKGRGWDAGSWDGNWGSDSWSATDWTSSGNWDSGRWVSAWTTSDANHSYCSGAHASRKAGQNNIPRSSVANAMVPPAQQKPERGPEGHGVTNSGRQEQDPDRLAGRLSKDDDEKELDPEIEEELGFLTWKEKWTEVLQVRFSQEQIHPLFPGRGPVEHVLLDISNELAPLVEALPGDSRMAPTVRLLPPFEPIRCLRKRLMHADLISLDNRRLYALQVAAIERWPARCLVKVLVAEGDDSAALLPAIERTKLENAGSRPRGQHSGKPAAMLEHASGDVQVLLASRTSAWDLWNGSLAVLRRCGLEVTTESTEVDFHREEIEAEAPCQIALRAACRAFARERKARSAAVDEVSLVEHACTVDDLHEALEELRIAAASSPGVLVKRVGEAGDRDGYISVAAQKAALKQGGFE